MRLSREGASVAAADLNLRSASAVAKEIQAGGGQAIALEMDVTRKSDAERTVAETAAGQFDILVNNAGIARVMPTMEIDENDWDEHMAVNAKGVLFPGRLTPDDPTWERRAHHHYSVHRRSPARRADHGPGRLRGEQACCVRAHPADESGSGPARNSHERGIPRHR